MLLRSATRFNMDVNRLVSNLDPTVRKTNENNVKDNIRRYWLAILMTIIGWAIGGFLIETDWPFSLEWPLSGAVGVMTTGLVLQRFTPGLSWKNTLVTMALPGQSVGSSLLITLRHITWIGLLQEHWRIGNKCRIANQRTEF